jgi:uncharacterized protein
MWFATQPVEEPDDLSQLVETIHQIGDDRIVFASDWPHHDFDHPQHVLGLPFSPEVKRNIMGANARRFLRLPASARG